MTTLDHYAEVNPSTGAIDRTSVEPVAFLPMAAVAEDGRIVGAETRPLAEVAKGYTYFERGDVLMAKITPCMENGKAALANDIPTSCGFGSTEFHVLRPREGVDPRFLFYLIWNHRFRRDAARHMTGSAGQKRVPVAYLKNAHVPLVDEDEQTRVADLLDKANTVRQRRHETIGLVQELIGSLFLEMFGDPVTNPKGWRPSTFGSEVQALEYGPRFYNEKYSEDGVRIVRITDLDASGRLDFDSMPRLAVEQQERERYVLRPGDVIFARSGATVGKTAVSAEGDPDAIPGAYFIRLRFSPEIRPVYARQVLASESVQRIIVSRSRQSAQQNFSGPGIRELPLPVPPRDLQERFERAVSQCQATLATCRSAATDSSALFESLVDRLFDGSLLREGDSR